MTKRSESYTDKMASVIHEAWRDSATTMSVARPLAVPGVAPEDHMSEDFKRLNSLGAAQAAAAVQGEESDKVVELSCLPPLVGPPIADEDQGFHFAVPGVARGRSKIERVVYQAKVHHTLPVGRQGLWPRVVTRTTYDLTTGKIISRDNVQGMPNSVLYRAPQLQQYQRCPVALGPSWNLAQCLLEVKVLQFPQPSPWLAWQMYQALKPSAHSSL